MISSKNDITLIQTDNLVLRWRKPDGKVISQGKRLSMDCPLYPAEVRAYVEQGATAAVKQIRTHRKLSLREALDLLNEARGTVRYPAAGAQRFGQGGQGK